jgi:methyl-accepting chemotaxis protein
MPPNNQNLAGIARPVLVALALLVASDLPSTTVVAQANGLEPKESQLLAWSQQCASRCTETMEKWISSDAISEEKLFSRLYYPILDPRSKEPALLTEPPKFTTDYDNLADRDIKPIEEAFVAKSPDIVYVILVDNNGYLPAHIARFSQPLTGKRDRDLLNNRTKRIFCDKAGLQAARNTNPYLIQTYKRDTGEIMNDLSVPVYVNGKHWGAVRFGYHAAIKE